MNFKTNDLLYGFMRVLSTACPEWNDGKAVQTKKGNIKYREYLTIKEFNKNKKLIAGICACSTRTIERHIVALEERGLVEEGVEIVKNDSGKEYEYPCYWFPENESGKFKMIDQEVLQYLIHTRNGQCIRVYLYLLNKYQWKRAQGQEYIFTIKEIKEALGYSTSTKTAETLIQNILTSFNKEGILRYEKIVESVGVGKKVVPVERCKLTYVLQNKEELPKF